MPDLTKSILTGILLSAFLLPGCVTPVFVDYDREAASKFVQYKCFVIDDSDRPENPKSLALSPIATRRFMRELKAELKKRGYTDNCSRPDFRVRFQTVREKITRLDFNYPIRHTRFNYNCFTPDVGFFPPPYADQYDQGTFIVDIIDIDSEKLVWRSTYVERLRLRPHKNAAIRNIISKILDPFPPETNPAPSTPD